MSRAESEVFDTAERLGPVLGHAVRWYPTTWHRAIARHDLTSVVGPILAAVPGATAREGAEISRRGVVECFENGPLNGYLAAMIWGCGTNARNIGRMLRVFSENPGALERISGMVAALIEASPARAWDVITSENHLKMLGPAFGTKVAYFVALAHPLAEGAPYPLIADARVAAALGTPVTHDRSAYVSYCESANRLSRKLAPELRRPDQVEWALFELGA